ncbi:hypothetical protein H632_c5201p0 [Helicosporidium sp. ATCC 50920]|nr:hypothetical protein H632_c5201p0 [Helicosporidium sp. ATCC 50920]|eukprot:KDD71365.1 hypothetical protein H632_c5201p0 [Helicosporidium sp. ATCC 50920]
MLPKPTAKGAATVGVLVAVTLAALYPVVIMPLMGESPVVAAPAQPGFRKKGMWGEIDRSMQQPAPKP